MGGKGESKIKARLLELAWWAVKWFVAAMIFVLAVNVFVRLQRQVILSDALLNWIQQQQQGQQPAQEQQPAKPPEN